MSVYCYGEKDRFVYKIVYHSRLLTNTLKKIADRHNYLVRLEKRRGRSFPERAKMASEFKLILNWVKNSYASFLTEIDPFLPPDNEPIYRRRLLKAVTKTEPKAVDSETKSKGVRLKSKSKTQSSASKTETNRDERPLSHCIMPGRHFLSALCSVVEPQNLILKENLRNDKKKAKPFIGETDSSSAAKPKRSSRSAPKFEEADPELFFSESEHEIKTSGSESEDSNSDLELKDLSSESESESESEDSSSRSKSRKLKSRSAAQNSKLATKKVKWNCRNQTKARKSLSLSNRKLSKKIKSSEPAVKRPEKIPETLKSETDPKSQPAEEKTENLYYDSDPEAVRLRSKRKTLYSESDPKELDVKKKPEALPSESDSKEPSFKEKLEALYAEFDVDPKALRCRKKPETLNFESDLKALRSARNLEALKLESDPKGLRPEKVPETFKPELGLEVLRHRRKTEAVKSESEAKAPNPESQAWDPDYKSKHQKNRKPKSKTQLYEPESDNENRVTARKILNTISETEFRAIIAKEKKKMELKPKKPLLIPPKMRPIKYRPEDGKLNLEAVMQSVSARRPIGLKSRADRKEYRRQMRCLPQLPDSSPDEDLLPGINIIDLFKRQ